VYNPTISKKEKRKIIKWAKETTIMEKQLKKKHTHTLERVKRTTENQKIFDAT